MKEMSETLRSITSKHGGVGFEFAQTDTAAAAIWEGRKAALWSVQALKEDGKVWTTDVWYDASDLGHQRGTFADVQTRGEIACLYRLCLGWSRRRLTMLSSEV
jgi:D-lactate dehydrogenase (cytochrome)